MTVIEVFTDNWGVQDDGLLIASGFRTNAEAWRWIDRHQGEPVSKAEDTADWIAQKHQISD